jgi:HAD superfamily hydrolase (TIGR01509 family)
MHYDIRHVFWDNDGILVDTEPLYFQASAEVLAEVGISLSREQFVDISLVRGESVFDLAEQHHGPDRIRKMRKQRNQRYTELLLRGVQPMAGVTETLERLHGRVAMAIVTSSHRNHFEIIHRHTGLLRFFDFVLTREDYRHSKPHPEPYLTALARSAGCAHHSLVVEDSERGLNAARAAGLPCVVIPGNLNRQTNLASAHRVLSHVSEIPDLVFTA